MSTEAVSSSCCLVTTESEAARSSIYELRRVPDMADAAR
jgi:hypothetical protein